MKQKKDKRRALYVKARNIVRNNMEKAYNVTVTAANAHYFIKAFNIFQASRQELRAQKEAYRRKLNSN